jgi:hypothetical protein
LSIVLQETECNIALINEHWLLKNEIDLYVPKNFTLAASFCRQDDPHGGVSILVNEGLMYNEIDISHIVHTSSFEAACIYVDRFNLVFISLYRTPDSDCTIFLDRLEKLLAFILLKKPSSKILLGADFNIDFLKSDNCTESLVNILKSFNLYHVFKYPTKGDKCIDNISTNINQNEFEYKIWDYKISDHPILFFKLLIKDITPNVFKEISFRKLNEENLNMFALSLSNTNWEPVFHISDVNTSFKYFLDTVVYLFDLNCPRVSKKIRNDYKSKVKNKWFDESLKKMRNTITFLSDLTKIPDLVKQDELKKILSSYRKIYKNKIKEAKVKYNENFINSSNNACKAAWQVIKSESGLFFRKNNTVPPFSVEDFNNHYINVGKKVLEKARDKQGSGLDFSIFLNKTNNSQNKFSWKLVTKDDMVKIIKSLNSSNSEDAYGLSNKIVKFIAPHIIEPLTHLVNMVLLSSTFPNCLKVSKTIPLYKKGDKFLISNFRPISMVPVFSKIIESCVKLQIFDFLNFNNILNDNQFGFRPGLSTTLAVESVVSDILDTFESGGCLSVALLDLSRAFDSVLHNILLQKLEFYGIKDQELNFFKTYLCGRKQFVAMGKQNSNFKEVLAGVPQGSVLGPLLFILYINDLPNFMPCKTILYADDTSFILPADNFHSATQGINNIIESGKLWFNSNFLEINNEKTEKICFTLRNIQEQNTNSVKLLGITLDPKLTWEIHSNNIISKLSRVCFLLRKLKNCVSKHTLLIIYHSLFHSHLLYGNILWGNSSGAGRIFIWQKKALRIMFQIPNRVSCKPFFIENKIMTLPNIFIYQNLVFVKENLNKFVPCNAIHGYITRHSEDLHIPQARLTKFIKSYKFLQIKLFNKLPITFRKQENINMYKSKLSNWLVNRSFYSIEEFLNNSDFSPLSDSAKQTS